MLRCVPSFVAVAVLAAGPILAAELSGPAPATRAPAQSVSEHAPVIERPLGTERPLATERPAGQDCPSWGEFDSSGVDGVEVRTRWCDSYDQASLILQVEWRAVGGRPAAVTYRGFMLPAGDVRCPSEDRAREGDGVSRQLFGRLSLTRGDRRSASAMHVPAELRRGHRLRICYFVAGPPGRTD